MGEDWGGIALYLGYKDEHEMLTDLYCVKGMSTREIGERVGMKQPTVLRRLRIAGINRRTRGGPQSFQRLWYKLHLLDQRWVFFSSDMKIAKRLKISLSLVYKFKRAMKGGFDGLQPDTTGVDVGEVSEQT